VALSEGSEMFTCVPNLSQQTFSQFTSTFAIIADHCTPLVSVLC